MHEHLFLSLSLSSLCYNIYMRYVLIYNPKAGKGKIKKDVQYITSFFQHQNKTLDVHETTSKEDAKDFLIKSDKTYDVVMAAGGDGTISTVVNGMMQLDKKPALAVLPYGSANDISHILGFGKSIKKALKQIITTTPVMMDINQMNEHYFVYTAAAGLFTRISYDISRKDLKQIGQIAYYIEGIKDLISDYDFDMSITIPEKTVRNRYTLVLGLAANRVGGIPLVFKKDAKLDDGLFDLHLFERKNIFSKLNVLAFFVRFGKKVRSDRILSAQSFKIKTNKQVKWNADGEHVCDGNIEIKVLHRVLPVIVNKKAKKKMFSQ